MSAISLESDDADLNAASLLFSQLIPMMDTLQKMTETRQENASPLPVSSISDDMDLRQTQPDLSPLFINGVIKKSEAYASHFSKMPIELSQPASFEEYTAEPSGDDSIPRQIMECNPLTTRVISDANPEITLDNDKVAAFRVPINDPFLRSTGAQEIVAQSEFALKEKKRIPDLEIKAGLNQPEQVVKEIDVLKSPEILSVAVKTNPVDTSDLPGKEAITFSPLFKAAQEVAISPALSSPELVVNTLVDFINKKITSSPTEAVFSQGPKKIALTELQFHPQDLMSLKVDNYTAKLKVYPPDLGQIIAEIQIHDGQTELTIRTENPQVKHFVEQHLTHLRESFEQSNISLGQVNIQDNSSKDTSSRQQAFYRSSTETTQEVENAPKAPYSGKKSSEQTIDTYA